MSKKEELLAAARAYAYSQLPAGEVPRGFVTGTQRMSFGMYFLIGVFTMMVGDNNRMFGIAFSDQTIVFIGYHKGKSGYHAVKTIIRPINEVQLQRKLMSHHIVLTNDKGGKARIIIPETGLNQKEVPVLAKTFGLQ